MVVDEPRRLERLIVGAAALVALFRRRDADASDSSRSCCGEEALMVAPYLTLIEAVMMVI